MAENTRWAQNTHVKNGDDEQVVIKELGQGTETVWNSNSSEARFESESKRIIIKQLGHGSYARVFATIGESDAQVLLTDYEDAKSGPEKQAVIEKMRASLQASKVLRSNCPDVQSLLKGAKKEVRMLEYACNGYLEKGGRGVLRIIDPRSGPDMKTWYSMQLMTGGTLKDLADTYIMMPPTLGTTVPAGFIYHMIAQIAETLRFLHFGHINGKRNKAWKPIAHCDLHADNFLLGYTDSAGQFGNYPDVVIADFGLAIVGTPTVLDDPVKRDLFFYRQVKDLRDGAAEALGRLISKADADKATPIHLFEQMQAVTVRHNNYELGRVLTKLVKAGQEGREKFYRPLPASWTQYFSQPSVSDEELVEFLARIEIPKCEKAADNPAPAPAATPAPAPDASPAPAWYHCSVM